MPPISSGPSAESGQEHDLPYTDASFGRVLSSLFFHHLPDDAKRWTAQEIFRVLRPGGELHVADWGKPQNGLMRGLFYAIQLLDGFETTRGNVRGMLPEVFSEAGFADIRVWDEIPTMLGTMTLFGAVKKHHTSCRVLT